MEGVVQRVKHCLKSNEKQMILNLFETFNDSNVDNCYTTTEIVNTISSSLGISSRTVFRVIAEKKTEGTVKSPSKKKPRLSKFDKIDEFDKSALRRKVHDFFIRGELPTLDKILITLEDLPDLRNISRSTLYILLKELGFDYGKRKRNSFLMERAEIILWRRRYLNKIREARSQNKSIYYMDETWVNAGHTKQFVWTDTTIKSSKQAFLDGLSTGLKNPSGKGKRLIITHIGSINGFVEGGLLVFESKKTGDYHQDMDANVFEAWFKDILPKLDEGCVIVMDNAPYHSRKLDKAPSSNNKKSDIQEWLKQHDIDFNENMLKLELLELVKQSKCKYESYAIDKMAEESERTVFRLPPYHCELNPIELIWADMKGYVARNNRTFKINDVKELLTKSVGEIDAEKWRKCIDHTIQLEEKMFQIDNAVESAVERIQFDVSEDEHSSDEE